MNPPFWSSIDIHHVKAGGEFGRRITQIIEGNLLQVDVPKSFLSRFQNRAGGGYMGFGKFIDATVWLAYQTGHPSLIQAKDRILAELLATQDDDGYIGIVQDKNRRTRELWDLHERSYLILALTHDHRLFQAEKSLAAARRLADLILRDFAQEPALRPDTSDGFGAAAQHVDFIPFTASNLGLDFALLELSKETGDHRYRDFVVQFLKIREFDPKIECGPSSLSNHAYSHMGHCLAQLNLYFSTQDATLLQPAKKVLEFLLHDDGMLITGSCSEGECWHQSQSGLQNTAETCTGFYGIQLMDALLRIEGKSIYGDLMERAITNAMFAAVSPDGRWSRYHTPFDGIRHYDMANQDTFCCPNNFRRFMSRLAGWIYYRTPDGVAVNLYNSSSAKIPLPDGTILELSQETDYPTSGRIRIHLNPAIESEFTLRLRIPRWCKKGTLQINGSQTEDVSGGEFHPLRRVWRKGDGVELDLPMPWRFVRGRKAQTGRVAVMRGPSIYTLNPARNPQLTSHPLFETRQMIIDPALSVESTPDESVRPGGVAAVVKTWEAGPQKFWPHLERVPTTLTEFPDPEGQGIYFTVPNPASATLVDDELLSGKS
jgi:uncharacterized protein